MGVLVDYLALYPIKVLHDLVGAILYSNNWKIPMDKGKRMIGKISIAYPLFESPHIIMMWLGLYEYSLIFLMKKYLRKGDTFLDVGANIGYFSAYALSIVGEKGQVFAFEPDPRSYSYLLMLKTSNPKYNISIERIALSNRTGKAVINQTKDWGTTTLVREIREESNIAQKLVVKSIRLDNYLNKKNIKQIKLIKIDVEGFEMQVLQGLSSFLMKTKSRPVIMVEVYPYAMEKTGMSLGVLDAWLKRYKYSTLGNIEVLRLLKGSSDMYNLVLLPDWMARNNNISSQH